MVISCLSIDIMLVQRYKKVLILRYIVTEDFINFNHV